MTDQTLDATLTRQGAPVLPEAGPGRRRRIR